MSQPLFQETYQVGDKFPFYFAGTAMIIGGSAMLNSRLVSKINLQVIVSYAFLWVWAWSALFLIISLIFNELNLVGFIIFSVPTFAAFGFLFSNVNALALAPMGHIAGTASAAIGTCSNILAILIGACATYFFVSGPTPLIVVFFFGASFNIFLIIALNQFKLKISEP
jgi:DHA1 family bicyclomycin/chloramphenicol resistance-like MFS transporter